MLKRIILALLILTTITKIEETKMGWNPANWQITDILQGQESPTWFNSPTTPYTANNTGSAANILSNANSSSNSSPQVLGDNTGMGYMYYDASTGKVVSSDPNNNPTYNPNPTYSRYNADGTPYVDPYSQWGGQANFNNLQSGFNTQKQMIGDTAGSAFDTAAGKYNRSILDFLDSARLGQQTIDNKSTENELAKMQGTSDILGMVGRGIRSGGVMLNNKNSSDSSGAEAIALAYGDIGQREMGKVGNQYETGKMGINDMQDAFDVQQQAGVRNLQGSRDDSVNTIMGDVSKSLAELDAKMVDASMPERIAIEQEKARIKAAGIAKLQAYDSALTSGVKDIGPMSRDEVLQKAGTMRRAGTSLGAGMFDYTTQAPIAMQGQEPAGANLPLFVLPRNRKGV